MHRAASLSLLLALAAPLVRAGWITVPDANTVPTSGIACRDEGSMVCLGSTASAAACQALCANTTAFACGIYTWSSGSHHCWARRDGRFAPVPWPDTVSGCNTATVTNCTAPSPNVAVQLLPQRGAAVSPLSPAVTFDWWLRNDTHYGEKWANASCLTIDLEDPDLLTLARAYAPAILRLGGSPEDSIMYDVDGGCVPGSMPQPSPSYYCSQVHPYVYGCLTPTRWRQLLEFGNLVYNCYIFFEKRQTETEREREREREEEREEAIEKKT